MVKVMSTKKSYIKSIKSIFRPTDVTEVRILNISISNRIKGIQIRFWVWY